jgi:hypothetical protein
MTHVLGNVISDNMAWIWRHCDGKENHLCNKHPPFDQILSQFSPVYMNEIYPLSNTDRALLPVAVVHFSIAWDRDLPVFIII